jgi:hypothetical protein
VRGTGERIDLPERIATMLVEHGQQPDSEIDSRRRSLIVCQSFKNCIFGQVESLVGIASQCCAVSYEPGELGFETLMKIGHLALLLAVTGPRLVVRGEC